MVHARTKTATIANLPRHDAVVVVVFGHRVEGRSPPWFPPPLLPPLAEPDVLVKTLEEPPAHWQTAEGHHRHRRFYLLQFRQSPLPGRR